MGGNYWKAFMNGHKGGRMRILVNAKVKSDIVPLSAAGRGSARGG